VAELNALAALLSQNAQSSNVVRPQNMERRFADFTARGAQARNPWREGSVSRLAKPSMGRKRAKLELSAAPS